MFVCLFFYLLAAGLSPVAKIVDGGTAGVTLELENKKINEGKGGDWSRVKT